MLGLTYEFWPSDQFLSSQLPSPQVKLGSALAPPPVVASPEPSAQEPRLVIRNRRATMRRIFMFRVPRLTSIKTFQRLCWGLQHSKKPSMSCVLDLCLGGVDKQIAGLGWDLAG